MLHLTTGEISASHAPLPSFRKANTLLSPTSRLRRALTLSSLATVTAAMVAIPSANAASLSGIRDTSAIASRSHSSGNISASFSRCTHNNWADPTRKPIFQADLRKDRSFQPDLSRGFRNIQSCFNGGQATPGWGSQESGKYFIKFKVQLGVGVNISSYSFNL